jgi:hypothetical protein
MPHTKRAIQEDAVALAHELGDAIEDFVNRKSYAPNEAVSVMINAIMSLTTYPLEELPPAQRAEVITEFLEKTRMVMDEYNAYLRKELGEGH